MSSNNKFFALDYVIFVIIFGISLGIGVYHGYIGRRQRTTQSYLMADRQLTLIPVALSMIVSVLSSNTILGVPAEVYTYGITIVLKAGGTVIASTLGAVLIVPLLYPLKLISTYEYLELRFRSKHVRKLGAAMLIMTQVLYTSTVIIGCAVSFTTAVGLPPWVSILIITVLGSLDTALGGFKGVIWTDVFQSIIMLIGILIIFIMGTVRLGGFGNIWQLSKDWGRIDISVSADPTERINLFSGLIGYGFTWWAFYSVNQPQVQRFSALSTQREAILSILSVPIGFTIFHFLSVMLGLMAFAHFATIGCDPMTGGDIMNSNQLLVYFVMHAIDVPGIPGALVSCLFCAALSTQSSSLNAMAAVVWVDFLSERFAHWSDKKKSYFLRISVLFLGGICGVTALALLYIGGNLQQLSVSFFSLSLGPLLGIFLLGGFFPFANAKGAFVGGIVAMCFNGWLLLGQTIYKTQRLKLPMPSANCSSVSSVFNHTSTMLPSVYTSIAHTPHDALQNDALRWLYSVSFTWYGLIGCVVTLIVGLTVSVITGCEKGHRIPPQYLSPLLRPFLPPPDADMDDKKENLLTTYKKEPNGTSNGTDSTYGVKPAFRQQVNSTKI